MGEVEDFFRVPTITWLKCGYGRHTWKLEVALDRKGLVSRQANKKALTFLSSRVTLSKLIRKWGKRLEIKRPA